VRRYPRRMGATFRLRAAAVRLASSNRRARRTLKAAPTTIGPDQSSQNRLKELLAICLIERILVSQTLLVRALATASDERRLTWLYAAKDSLKNYASDAFKDRLISHLLHRVRWEVSCRDLGNFYRTENTQAQSPLELNERLRGALSSAEKCEIEAGHKNSRGELSARGEFQLAAERLESAAKYQRDLDQSGLARGQWNELDVFDTVGDRLPELLLLKFRDAAAVAAVGKSDVSGALIVLQTCIVSMNKKGNPGREYVTQLCARLIADYRALTGRRVWCGARPSPELKVFVVTSCRYLGVPSAASRLRSALSYKGA
jgi:hypothetical protein